MKLFIIVAAVALANAAKLDKTYLPPRTAQTTGGSGNFLQTPVAGPEYQGQNGFAQRDSGFGPRENGFSQRENGFPQRENGFSQRDNGFSQRGNGFPENDYSQNANGNYNNGFDNFEDRPERAQAAFERNAAIVRQDNENDGETYAYAYETENGIYAEESGVATNGVKAQGGFSYTGDDGQVYSIRFTADQNGFVPQGDHLPTPPPVPEEILRALEQNARDEAAGIYDDGSYDEAKYGSSDEYNSNNAYNNNAYSNNAYNNGNQGDEDSVVTNSALFRDSRPGFNQEESNEGFNQRGLNQGFNNGVSNQGFNNGGSNQGFSRGSNQGATKAYLPPFASQRGAPRSRQQAFSARNGYKY